MTTANLLTASAHALPLDDSSVQCIVTSPPYYGLRQYHGDQSVEWPAVTFRLNEWTPEITIAGCDPECDHEWGDITIPPVTGGKCVLPGAGKAMTEARYISERKAQYCRRCGGWRGGLGSEPDPVMYVGHLILCLREWRRVLRDDGTLFLNLGDSYSGSWGNYGARNSNQRSRIAERLHRPAYEGDGSRLPPTANVAGLKPKNMIGIPWMTAFAARADGWWLRSDIIWAKRAPMPGSQQDRPTTAHEYIFLLTKSQNYYWDQEAVKQPVADESVGRAHRKQSLMDRTGNGTLGKQISNGVDQTHGYAGLALGRNGKTGYDIEGGATIRSVWTLGPDPYKGAHYAPFPREIPRRAILAGTSARGCCPCGAPWKRVVTHTGEPDASYNGSRFDIGKTAARDGGDKTQRGERTTKCTIGWQPTCACYRIAPDLPIIDGVGFKEPLDPIPCLVLDPFSGTGTTVAVAVELGRRAIGVDIHTGYNAEHGAARVAGAQPALIPGGIA